MKSDTDSTDVWRLHRGQTTFAQLRFIQEHDEVAAAKDTERLMAKYNFATEDAGPNMQLPSAHRVRAVLSVAQMDRPYNFVPIPEEAFHEADSQQFRTLDTVRRSGLTR